MTSNSHTLACVWLSEGTLSPSKFLLGAAGGKHGQKGTAVLPPPLAPPMREIGSSAI